MQYKQIKVQLFSFGDERIKNETGYDLIRSKARLRGCHSGNLSFKFTHIFPVLKRHETCTSRGSNRRESCAKYPLLSSENHTIILLTKSNLFVIMNSIKRRKMIQDELKTPKSAPM